MTNDSTPPQEPGATDAGCQQDGSQQPAHSPDPTGPVDPPQGAAPTVLPSGATVEAEAVDPDASKKVSRRTLITASAFGAVAVAGATWAGFQFFAPKTLSAEGAVGTVTNSWSDRQLDVILGSGVCEAPQHIAFERGLWEQAGLNVQLRKAGAEEDTQAAVGSGKYAATNGIFFSWLGPIYNGVDVKLSTGLHQGCLRLVVPTDGPITEVAQLKGKKIGVSSLQGSATNFFALDLLDAGISSDPAHKQVEWVVIENDLLPEALAKGQVDAIAASDPIALKATYDGSAYELTNNRQGANAQEFCCAIAINGQFVREDPVTARKFVTAWAEGSRWVGANLEETARIQSEKNYVAASAEDILPQLQSYGFEPSSNKLRDALVPGIEKFKKTGFLKESADAATLADRVFVDLHLNW